LSTQAGKRDCGPFGAGSLHRLIQRRAFHLANRSRALRRREGG
jgi:hypothetical protein